MSFSQNVWNQPEGITADDLIRALEKDGWTHDTTQGAVQAYLKNGDRVTIHYHPRKTFGPNLLKALLADIGWSESDMRRLKLIK